MQVWPTPGKPHAEMINMSEVKFNTIQEQGHSTMLPTTPFSIVFSWISFLVFLSVVQVDGLSTVVYGPQSRELLLLTSKLAAREQIATYAICAPGTEAGCRRLMYGAEYADAGVDAPGNAKPISDGDEMLMALHKATCLTLIGYDDHVEPSAVNTLLASAGSDLRKIVLVSKIGVTKAKGGFLGGGKELRLLESENAIRQICEDKHLNLSIVRAGALKGGGPGETGNDLGLSNVYYNSLIDSVEASVTMAHDKYTLGFDCARGDPFELPNLFSLIAQRSSFEPIHFETNRIVAASAVVAALLIDEPMEFTVSSAKGTQLLSLAELTEVLRAL
jgi:hypothetical protein